MDEEDVLRAVGWARRDGSNGPPRGSAMAVARLAIGTAARRRRRGVGAAASALGKGPRQISHPRDWYRRR